MARARCEGRALGRLAAFLVMALGYLQVTTGLLPLGSADPTARLEGYRDLARELDARARAEGAPYVLTQGYALTSLMRIYGDKDVSIIQPEQRIRWVFESEPPERTLQESGLALGEAGRNFGLFMQVRYRTVEPLGTLTRRRDGQPVETYELFRIANPYAPVLDAECISGDVTYRRDGGGFERECVE